MARVVPLDRAVIVCNQVALQSCSVVIFGRPSMSDITYGDAIV